LAIAALVLGILSFFTFGITAIPAIILGIISLVRIEKSGGRITGRGFAIGGIVVPVVAVPVLLMIILMPALNRVKKQARSVVCQANLKQWALIFAMYTEDNNGYFFSGEGGDSGRWWMDPLRTYYRNNNKLFLCPTAAKPYTKGGQNSFGAWTTPEGDSGSYGLNGWICNLQEGKTELWGHGPIENYWRTPKIHGANNIPVFLDAMWVNAWPKSTDQPPGWEFWRKNEVNINEMRCFCVNRHQGYVNVIFMDWSVRKVGLKELWTLNWHRNYETSGPWTRSGGVQPSDWPPWMRNFRDY
jgi:prepilin-type processing-associated H-X9-DG protein